MKNRTEEIWTALTPLIEELSLNDISRTLDTFNTHAESLLASMRAALISCDQQAAALRHSGEKGETAYIAISFLDSSYMTGAYCLRVDFYDDSFLTDIAEACAYFSYARLIPYYRESVETICTKASKRFIRFMDYEKDALAWKYKNEVLYKMALVVCTQCLQHPETTGFLPSLTVTDDCVFTFGRLFNDQQFFLRMPKKTAEL